VIAFFTMRSVGAEVTRSTTLINTAIITAQLYSSAALPYTSTWDIAISVTQYFSLKVDSSGDSNCFAPDMTANNIFIMNITSVFLVFIWITLFECFTGNGLDYEQMVHYFTLAFFLLCEPLYVNTFKIVHCVSVIVDATGATDLRAFYMGETECYNPLQFGMLGVLFLFSLVIIIGMCFHNEKDRATDECGCCSCFSCCYKSRHCNCGIRKWAQEKLNQPTLRAITEEMEKPYHKSHPLTRLWGYILILIRILVTAVYTMFPSDGNGRILSAWVLILIFFLMGALTYRFFPYLGGKTTNQAAVWSWVGLMTLATCQLGAEIQIRGNVDSEHYDYLKMGWAATMIIH